MKKPALLRTALALALLLPLIQVAACAGPGYYAQAISGHLGLMRGRQEISKILAAGDSAPELTHKLELAIEIREFATAQLGLPENGS